MTQALLQVQDLRVEFHTRRGVLVAVDRVSFDLRPGEVFGIVGESGAGKSLTGQAIIGLLEPPGRVGDGRILLQGRRIDSLPEHEMRRIRGRRIGMIFQDPYASLNPRWRVGAIVSEPIRAFGLLKHKADIARRTNELLTQVGLSPLDREKYPHEFSGGQRQRISIARALASQPEFIVCDEPTSALDVSVQAQILNLMKKLQQDFHLSYLFISHDLAVVRHMADEVGVMYLGRLCEVAPADVLFEQPRHPYTRLLLATIPDVEMTGRRRVPMAGEIPNPIDPPSGCAFHPRCPQTAARCRHELPALTRLENGVHVACHALKGNATGPRQP